MQVKIIQHIGQRLHLHPLKAIYWEEQKALLLADLHLGKVTHFRKAGLPVPQAAGDVNWDRLISLLLDFKPQRVLFLGDLFHSSYNVEWEELGKLIQQFNEVKFELVLGNHDILSEEQYQSAQLILHKEPYSIKPFLFSHHPLETIPSSAYNLAGHIHPCVHLKGNGRQSLRLPCFYFGKQQGLLPAFGSFTGMGRIQTQHGDQVFVITEDSVIQV